MSIRFENMTQAQVHEFTQAHPVHCTEDHCTPEERAVIEAALSFHATGVSSWEEREGGNSLSATAMTQRMAFTTLMTVCERLHATRSRSEAGE